MLVEGADAGDAKKILKFAEKALLIIAGKIDCGGGHWVDPFWCQAQQGGMSACGNASVYPKAWTGERGGRDVELRKARGNSGVPEANATS